MILLAVVWHFWIAVALAVPSILVLVLTIGGYLKKVVAPRYPQKR